MNTYLHTSKEFQPLNITRTVGTTTEKVTTNVQYMAVVKGTPFGNGTLQPTTVLDGEVGFFTDGLAPGYWEIAAKIIDTPEEPLIYCGVIRIK